MDKAEKKWRRYYYSGSHKLGLWNTNPLFSGSSQTVKSLKKLNKCKIITPTLNPGDCIIHNSLVVHGSKKNKSKISRRGITLRFLPFKSKVLNKNKKYYEKSLKKQIKSRM